MTKTNLSKIIAITTTICIILLGLLFIIFCAHLYFTGGDQPYSRESVGKYLIVLAIPSAITAAVVVSGFVYAYLNGIREDEKTPRTSWEILESLTKRYDVSTFEEDVEIDIIRERKSRKTFAIISYIFSAIAFSVVCIYLIFFANFTVETLNADVVAALAVALPVSLIGIGIHVPRIYHAEDSAKKEIDIIKSYIKETKPARIQEENIVTNGIDYTTIAKYVILTASVVLLILGIFNGGVADVFAKAVKICTECIGLG